MKITFDLGCIFIRESNGSAVAFYSKAAGWSMYIDSINLYMDTEQLLEFRAAYAKDSHLNVNHLDPATLKNCVQLHGNPWNTNYYGSHIFTSCAQSEMFGEILETIDQIKNYKRKEQ